MRNRTSSEKFVKSSTFGCQSDETGILPEMTESQQMLRRMLGSAGVDHIAFEALRAYYNSRHRPTCRC